MVLERLSYSEMIKFKTFGDRLAYLSLWNRSHQSPRSISNSFYHSPAWIACRDAILTRDLGSDLGVIGCDINGLILVHHINPLIEEDIEEWTDNLFDPDNLITVSTNTHNIIHYGPKRDDYVERKPGDTKLW